MVYISRKYPPCYYLKLQGYFGIKIRREGLIIMEQLYQKNIPVNIEDEMKKSYMDYAMSVIIGRAIPDVRDGMKPVHRRVLYAMSEMGNVWNKAYKKSARIVGDIIGKYHPHGDTAAYDTLVRMAQDFSMRYPLIDGQGNFGSVDGDPPAAMRYTEIRMARLAEEMLADLEKETVDFVPNYDASMQEPTVLPARIPALLLNGTSGIAVGVATNIPPHNLRELIDGTIALIRNPEITIEELMHHIKGPDFPTAGFINGREGIISAYNTGRGSIRMRSRAIIERNARNDRESIIITELPYLVNKANLMEKISELVKEKKIEGIADLRDESDRDGIRIVIDLKREEPSGVILNQLYKHTQMETSFGVIMLAIDRNQPKVLNLKEVLQKFVDFRKEVITRRTIFDLRKTKERAHILEGLIVALNHIDAVVQLIKKSKSPQEAAQALSTNFGLTEIQARAILDMRLQRLTGLERDKILDEYKELSQLIITLQGILDDPQKVLDIIVSELEEVHKKYGDERRTEIVGSIEDINIEDMIVEEDMVVTVSHYGYIKRNPVSLYRSQRRGGKGKVGMGTKEEDFVEKIFIASTHHYILIFTNVGRVYWLKVYQLPQAGRAAKGKAIVNLVNLSQGERVASVLPVREFTDGKSVVMVTKRGIIKKTELEAYSNPRSGGIIAITIDEGDDLIDVQLTRGDQDIFLGTRKGQSIRFHEGDVRDMGRTARGVIGIRMDDDDAVVGMEIPTEGNSMITVSENGYGKRTAVEEYRQQNRGGQGVINLKTVSKIGNVSGVLQVTGEEDVILISDAGKIIRLKVAEVPLLHRSTQGVKLIELDPEEKLVGVARAERDTEEKDNGLSPDDIGGEEEIELDFGTGDQEDVT
jgi:DNA gyrase subunit A